MEINTDQPLKALKAQILEFIELKTELARLSLVEYVAKIASYVFAAIVGIIIISLIFLSVFIAISFFIGQWVHSYGLGFLISAAIYLLMLWYFVTIGRKQVQNYMIKKILEQTPKSE
jgi:glucan phosphoethanolaminetransferase (alkaline phosphatase superfamily)